VRRAETFIPRVFRAESLIGALDLGEGGGRQLHHEDGSAGGFGLEAGETVGHDQAGGRLESHGGAARKHRIGRGGASTGQEG
jgi:hypothetical protein